MQNQNPTVLIIGFDKYYARMLELEAEELFHHCIRIDAFNGIDSVYSSTTGNERFLCILNSDLPTDSGDLSLLLEFLTVKRIKTALIGSKRAISFFNDFIEGNPDLVRLFRKPFPIDELITFIFGSVHTFSFENTPSSTAEIKLLSDPYSASFDGNIIYFTPIEFKVLVYLVQMGDTVSCREKIFSSVWKKETSKANPVDVYIRHLRKKFSQYFDFDIIKTVRNEGYTINSNIRWKF